VTQETAVDPVVVSRLAVCPLAEAFRAWTERIDEWWPRARTVGGEAVARIVLEAAVGGRLYERWHDGREHAWATVTAWDPPERLGLAWIDGDAAGTEVAVSFTAAGPASTRVTIEHGGFERIADGAGTEVAVSFTAAGPASTRVTIEHGGFERIADGADIRARYARGPDSEWNAPLSAFGDAVVDPAVHRYFGVRLNNESWGLFADADDAERLLHAVHTSAWHWRQIGAPENLARGDWMCSHAYAVLGHGALASIFAQSTLRICVDNGIGDFDRAYAYEAAARAAAASGDLDEARRLRVTAREAGDAIADDEDKAIFDGDLVAGPWYGADVD
jgi:hypothetical protein